MLSGLRVPGDYSPVGQRRGLKRLSSKGSSFLWRWAPRLFHPGLSPRRLFGSLNCRRMLSSTYTSCRPFTGSDSSRRSPSSHYEALSRTARELSWRFRLFFSSHCSCSRFHPSYTRIRGSWTRISMRATRWLSWVQEVGSTGLSGMYTSFLEPTCSSPN